LLWQGEVWVLGADLVEPWRVRPEMHMYVVMEDKYKEDTALRPTLRQQKRPQKILALDAVIQARPSSLLSRSPTWDLEEENQGTGPGG